MPEPELEHHRGYGPAGADSDRRTKTIRLTPRGETLQRKIATVVADTRSQLLVGIADRADDILEPRRTR